MNQASQLNLSRPGRKPTRTGKLDALSPEERETIKGWLVTDNLTYAQAGKRIEAQFGFKSGRNLLSVFYRKYCNTVTLPETKTPSGPVVAEVVVQVRIPRQ
jgi:hypothetical protein